MKRGWRAGVGGHLVEARSIPVKRSTGSAKAAWMRAVAVGLIGLVGAGGALGQVTTTTTTTTTYPGPYTIVPPVHPRPRPPMPRPDWPMPVRLTSVNASVVIDEQVSATTL